MLALTRNNGNFPSWRNLSELHRDFFDAFRDFDEYWSKRSYPATQISTDENTIRMTMCLPGYEPGEIDIQYLNECITISAARDRKQEEEYGKALRSERFHGEFKETYRLGAKIEFNKAKATYKNGMLELELPKAESEKPRKISVK